MKNKLKQCSTLCLTVALTIFSGLALPYNTNYQMCTLQANTTWFPTIDGNIKTDAGWINAFAYRADSVQMGTPDVQVWSNAQATSTGTLLNFAFEVTNDATYDDTDTLILAFANGSSYHRIHVKPIENNGSGLQGTCPSGSFVPRQVEYWPGTPGTSGSVVWGTKQTFPAQNIPAWLKACTQTSGPGSSNTWTTEMQITIGGSGLAIPTNTEVGVYLNAYRVSTVGGVQTQKQYTWPATSGVIFNQVENTPLPATWGVGRILAADNSACKGVYLLQGIPDPSNPGWGANIGTGHPGTISDTSPNIFSAAVYNDGPPADHVRATFSYFPWGSTIQQWKSIPGGCTPAPCNTSNPGATVPAPTNATTPSTTTFQTTTGWTAPLSDAGHACVRVDLSSDLGGTVFKQRSAFNNFQIRPGSRVEMKAKINAGPSQGIGGEQKLWVSTTQSLQYAYSVGAISEIKPGVLTEQKITTFYPYLLTDQYVVNEGKKQFFMEPMPIFGVVVQHPVTARVQRAFELRQKAILEPAFLLDPMWREIESGPLASITPSFVSKTRQRVRSEISAINKERLKLPIEERKELPPVSSQFERWTVAKPKPINKDELKQQRNTIFLRANQILADEKDKPKAKLWTMKLPGIELNQERNGFWLQAKPDQPVDVPIIIDR